MLDAVSVLTLILGVLVKLVGFPGQFIRNQARRSTEGLSRSFYFLAVLSYAMWSLQGYLSHDLALCIGQGIGVFTAGAIVAQTVIYRGRPPAGADPGPAQPEAAAIEIEIQTTHMLGHTTLQLPRSLDWPPRGAIVRAQRVPDGWLLRVVGETRPPAEQP